MCWACEFIWYKLRRRETDWHSVPGKSGKFKSWLSDLAVRKNYLFQRILNSGCVRQPWKIARISSRAKLIFFLAKQTQISPILVTDWVQKYSKKPRMTHFPAKKRVRAHGFQKAGKRRAHARLISFERRLYFDMISVLLHLCFCQRNNSVVEARNIFNKTIVKLYVYWIGLAFVFWTEKFAGTTRYEYKLVFVIKR